MNNFFLKMKHWQLFLLLYLPIIVAMIFMFRSYYLFFTNIKDINNPLNPAEMFSFFSYTMPISFIHYIVWVGYLLTILHALNDRVPTQLKRNLTIPRLSIILPVLYSMTICLFTYYLFQNFFDFDFEKLDNLSVRWMVASIIIIPCHLLAIFAILYSFYVLAKLLKTAEKQRESDFEDFIAEFFFFWIFPIGIWFIQPRINKLFEQEKPESQIEERSERKTDLG